MKILGISLSHCCAICYIENNQILFLQEEDRLTRKRRQKGFPENALKYFFNKFKLKEQDIDICVYSDKQSYKRINKKIDAKKNIVMHHQLAHIFSGWAFSNNPDFYCLSIDGGGDKSWQSYAEFRDYKLVNWESNCGNFFKNNKFKSKFINFDRSIPFGRYWSSPAVYNFGMVDKNGIGGYEGKLMGLYAHGLSSKFDKKKFKYNASFSLTKKNQYYHIKTKGNPKIGNPKFVIDKYKNKYTLKEVKNLRKKSKKIIKEFDLTKKEDFEIASNFASLLQINTNNILEDLFKKNFIKPIPIIATGGTFANVVTNGFLNQKYDYFVVPCMGDEGLALGAAAYGAYINKIKLSFDHNICLGFESPKNKNINIDYIVESLKNKKIIGIIDGKMEFGPRALGSRSIISDPQNNSMNETINSRLGRVEYMPFAPVILENLANEVLEGWSKKHLSASHMTLTYKVKKKYQQLIKGVVHFDNTVRPQVINKNNTNQVYYNIVEKYFYKTKIPCLINTSFNAHGEPILLDVEDGINALKNNRIDVLIANNNIYQIENNQLVIKK